MTKLNICFVTFNCGRNLVNVSTFSNALPFSSKTNLNAETPDLVVISLQELAPIAHSFLGGSFLQAYTSRFVEAVKLAHPADPYEHMIARHLGMTSILIFAKPEFAARVVNIETAGVGVGLWDMGNKGAVAARLHHRNDGTGDLETLTFVAAHLAPSEKSYERRNLDWKDIVRRLVFQPASNARKSSFDAASPYNNQRLPLLAEHRNATESKSQTGIFLSGSPLFFGGDLNYRSGDSGPKPREHLLFPQPTSDPKDPRHFSNLYSRDQLNRERKAGKTLHQMEEAAIRFPPSYKYSEEQHGRGTEDRWYWAQHRFPSWTDRILFSRDLANSTYLDILNYDVLALQPSSDHRPVSLTTRLDMACSKSLNVTSPFPLDSHWESRRRLARTLEIGVGVLAYLSLTWEGRALLLSMLVGGTGGWLVLRSIIS